MIKHNTGLLPSGTLTSDPEGAGRSRLGGQTLRLHSRQCRPLEFRGGMRLDLVFTEPLPWGLAPDLMLGDEL